MKRSKLFLGIGILICLLIQSCSSTKFVPEGEYLLASAKIKSDTKDATDWEMKTYIKQKPNFKTFELIKVPLAIYNLSGQDSTKWANRTLRKAGEPPVIYDSTQVSATVTGLTRVMTNKGYLNTQVTPEITLRNKKARIIYNIKADEPYIINSYSIKMDESIIDHKDSVPFVPEAVITSRKGRFSQLAYNVDSVLNRRTLVKKDNKFDLQLLDEERSRITYMLRRTGYYAVNKEYIGFEADTTIGNKKVDLELTISPFTQKNEDGTTSETPHLQYEIASVDFYIDYNPMQIGEIKNYLPSSVVERGKYRILYGERGEYIKPFVLLEKCYITPGNLYDEEMTVRTYNALSQLHILKNVNISYTEFRDGDTPKLRCIITCVPDKKQGISTEIEGTNSGKYFGVGAGVGYTHRNIFRGSEQFNARLRGNYEAITPSFTSFKDNYFEFGAETSLTFPRFMFPFLKRDFRKQLQASTQFSANYSIQRRPGFFTRTVLATGVKYLWHDRNNPLTRHAVDLIDVSYARIPKNRLDPEFWENLTEAARRYSFSDQFIISAGYTFTKTNRTLDSRSLRPIYTLRASVETAGNVLSAIASLTGSKRDKNGSRRIFGTQFAQYAKGSFDFSKTHFVDERNSFAWRVGGGIAYPYGNFEQIPIQKRFFSGGANNVRGWAVRELGPGKFYAPNSKKDNFYLHSGDIRLDANIEYRSKLFWVMEMGAFIDAGNIWTAKEYEGQEGGSFKVNRFYKEIAVAWGLGLRLDFNFVLVRLDCGWKAYDPSADPNVSRWPIVAPLKLGKNTAWHIAVGYPF